MSQARDRLDLLLEPGALQADIFTESLFGALAADERASQSGIDVIEHVDHMRSCLNIWRHPAVQFRLHNMENRLWARRLPFPENDLIKYHTRDSFLVHPAESLASFHRSRCEADVFLSPDPQWHVLPLVTALEAKKDLLNCPVGAVVGDEVEPAIGIISHSRIAEEG